jgi:hypothetical protein
MRASVMPPTIEANATIACFLRNAFVLPGAIPLRKSRVALFTNQ